MCNNKLAELMDSFFELNDCLEICRGYTQSQEPDMRALDNVLFGIQSKYREIYEQLRDFRGMGATSNE